VGYDAPCRLKLDGRTLTGKAWLEHKDLVFRGPERLVIPLAEIDNATAEGDVLRVRFGARRADFEIGSAAAKWARRITHPPSRLDKLGIKPGMSVVVLNLDDAAFLSELEAGGAAVASRSRSAAAGPRDADVIFFGADRRAMLDRLERLREIIRPAGAIWVVRPKGQKTITEADTMSAGKRAGLVDVKVVSFSESHTAEKFVIPVASRPGRRPA
jgi:hypothetical protein